MDAESLVTALVHLQLAASAAIVAVLLLRPLALRWCGAGTAYWLWLVVPLAATAALLPARELVVMIPTVPEIPILQQQIEPDLVVGVTREHVAAAPVVQPGIPHDRLGSRLLITFWLLGAGVLLTRSIVNTRRLSSGSSSGPALVGVLRPRLVLPHDFEARFSAEERVLILAHEEMHRVSRHTLVNALVEVARCASWFNPLLHWAAMRFRADQELACDTAVIAAHPEARRAYAEALLKAQVAGVYLPMGCAWSSGTAGRLAERIARLSEQLPGRRRRFVGAASIVGIGIAASYAAWAQQPPRIITVQQLNPESAAGVPDVSRPSISPAPIPAPTAQAPKGASSTTVEREPGTPRINAGPATHDSSFAIRAAFAMDAVTDDRRTRQVNGATVSNLPWDVGPDGRHGTFGTLVCRVTRDGSPALSGEGLLAELAANCQPIMPAANMRQSMSLVTGRAYTTEDAILQYAATHQELLRDPEYRELVLVQVRPEYERRYPRLALELRLSETEADRLFDLMADNEIARRAQFIAQIAAPKPTLERPLPGSRNNPQEYYRTLAATMQAVEQASDRKLEESIQALLGDKYVQWPAVKSRAQQVEREQRESYVLELRKQQMAHEPLQTQPAQRQ